MADPVIALDKPFRKAIVEAFGPEFEGVDPLIKASANPAFGDYQANAAMSLGKRLGKPPREVAAAIVAKLDLSGIAEQPEIAGPGFVNLRVLPGFLASMLAELRVDPACGVGRADKPDTVVVDYSSPNMAKEMHIGHIRSTIIGDAITRVLASRGHEVIRQNHIGDWGTAFGMLIEHVLDAGEGSEFRISDLNELYRAAKAKFDADPAFAERSRLRVVALQSGDADTLRLWRSFIEESKRHFDEAYARLGILLEDADYRGESFYNDLLPGVARELEERGFAKVSDGALCVFPDGFTGTEGAPIPLMIRKSDGGYGYDATDLAAIRYRVRELGATRLVYVTDFRQKQHFAMVFEGARMAGWLGDAKPEHVYFGAILGDDGKPFKTRSGDTVKLEDVLDEAERRADAIVLEKNPELGVDERTAIAHAIAMGAIKYADLSNDRIKDYVFSYDRMLAFDGNTAPYLQNAYVRIKGIFRKADASEAAVAPVVAAPQEKALAMRLLAFGAAVESVERTLEPHRLCTYLYELAADFHAFYEHCPVIQAAAGERGPRLALCDLTARTLKRGLELLGIDVVERM